MRLHLLLPLPLLACALAAQTPVVSPAHFTSATGLSNNVFPFGTATNPFRYAEVHDELQGPPQVFRAITFRHNPSATVFPAHSVTVDMWLSTATGTSATVVADFDLNHGVDKAQVITNKVVNHPESLMGAAPGPFVLRYPFDAPFVFGGNGPLYWEAHKTDRTNTTSITHDAASGAAGNTNPALQGIGPWGTGCRATGRTAVMTLSRTATMDWPGGTGTITINGTQGPADDAVITVLGFERDLAFGSVPLPFEIPTSASGSSGACFLYTEPVLMFPVPTNTAGASSTVLPVPLTGALNGLQAFFQNLALDAAANPFGLVASRVMTVNLVAPFGPVLVTRIFSSGNLNPTGSIGRNFALVTQFE